MARTLPQRSIGAATSRVPASTSASKVSSATHASCVTPASTARVMRMMPVFCLALGLMTPAIGLTFSFIGATLNLLSGSSVLSLAEIHRGSSESRASEPCPPPPAASAEPTRLEDAAYTCSWRAASTAARFACLFFVFPIPFL